jgi:hypothetical protein
MTILLHYSERVGCGATLRLDSGEPCLISVAQSGVRVIKSRLGWLGPILYDEKNVYLAAQTGLALQELFPEKRVPVTFRNPVLSAFTNAAWHCSTASEVAKTFNRAVISVEKMSMDVEHSIALRAAGQFGQLVQQHPTAILDRAILPLPMAGMKSALKYAWGVAPNDHLRGAIETSYVCLAQFQDGVGVNPIDPTLPADCPPEKAAAILGRYLPYGNKMQAEQEALLAEFREWKRSGAAD